MRYIVTAVIALLVGFFLARGCQPMKEDQMKQPAKVVEYAKQDTTATRAHVRTVEVVTVRNKIMHRVDTVRSERVRYVYRDSSMFAQVSFDTVGIVQLDTLSLENTQDVRFTDDGNGNASVSIRNSSPYFSHRNVDAFIVRPKQFSRISYGPSAGIAITPAGVQPYVGFGVTINLAKRR